MLGIEAVASYIPKKRMSNYDKKEKFAITDTFIKERIGVETVAVKSHSEETSTLCIKAYQNLKEKIDVKGEEIDVIIVVTQNPDFNLPQTSAIVHGKLGFPQSCASFDISLGCSGFVYGLSIIISFMQANKFKKGLLFTSDPYSKIIDPDDKNTSMLFGDAAAVSLISENPVYVPIDFTYGTLGKSYKDLICANNVLYMNGRAIANFVIKEVPVDVKRILDRNNLTTSDIDKFLFHQGSGFIVNSLIKKLELDPAKVVYDIKKYGNTVSSSIPLLIEKLMPCDSDKTILISGFGVGLSLSSAILKRVR